MQRRSMMLAAVGAVLGSVVGCGGGGGGGTGATALGSSPVINLAAHRERSWWVPDGLPAAPWHWTATTPDGSLMLATTIPGSVFLSRDRGASWTPAGGLPVADWIAADLSDDGQVVVAAAIYGGLYGSLDGGTSWRRIDMAVNPAGNLPYQSVAVSADGSRIVAAVAGGELWVAADGRSAAPSFQAAAMGGGGALASWWRAVDMDAAGSRVVAASHNGDAWVSDDGGATFRRLDVLVGGTGVEDGWYRLALSADGNTLALAGNEEYGHGVAAGSRSTGLYVGRFAAGAWTFERASAVAGNYTRVAIAAGSPVVVATLSGADGRLLGSFDNGATFADLPTPAGETQWRSVAVTGTANAAVLAAGTFHATPGLLYGWWGSLAP